ncbi:rRNA adenine N-6-methyltransferase family protein [Clostridium sp. AL.422]|uniref:rRNA adenine N-6-methyltransferase family protein n=1 Tax=Clostridium TaxID=1485 RepID=UPI00293DBE94|nr:MULTISPECIES: rRNA adenine N-6-methyltransferase family protein [unclassified Clostridium]MDV4152492.1 rRNA adenine N-6-methyltransferase family protein [Clostridium sp. AL.422]
MKPYDKKYVNEKINEYNNSISLRRIGNFEIKKFNNNSEYIDGYMYRKKGKRDFNVLELHGPDNIWMRISPLEIESSYMFIKYAKGKVGVVGLGLGYVAQELAKKTDIDEVVVYEKEKDIIDLYNSNFEENEKIKIINKDAFEAESEDFDYFYVDIYEYKLKSRVVEDYVKFNRLHKIKEYLFWGLEHFLLSCKYEEIVWVYIPELWMEISKKIFGAMQESDLLKHYRQLDEKLVSKVLAGFKEALDD